MMKSNDDAATAHLKYEVVSPHRCLLGEGPVWDAQNKSLIWVDILNGEIHEYNTIESTHKIISVNQLIGSVALCTNGDFLAALKNGLAVINRLTGKIKILHHPESHLPENRFNDGKCDPAGRFWIGSMSLQETPGAGNLHVLEKDFTTTKKIETVTISNGMAWSLNNQSFFYIDTPTYEVWAFDYDLATGIINNKRVAINIPKKDGYPDGMTIDNEGMLWIAHWDGWQVARWNPLTGEKLLSIPLPAARITSCTFGGELLQDLYVTSARVGLTETQLNAQPLAGSVFVIKHCGFHGVETALFDYDAAYENE